MRLDWKKRQIPHWLLCRQWHRGSSFRLAGLAVFTAALILGFPNPGGQTLSAQIPVQTLAQARMQADAQSAAMRKASAIQSMEAFLKRHKVGSAHRSRLAEAIVESAEKYDLNPRLVASIMIVESRGNPYAISGQDAVGIMQIHLPTWGDTADRENINLFKIEDNVDFGARILKDYVSRFGTWGGVKRYNGFIPGVPAWEESAQRYLTKVQHVYGSSGLPRT
jgi:soluble lytic murein transglycosylase-like protein